MVFSKAVALELCALNLEAYALATTGHCKLPVGFSDPVAIRMPVGDRPFFLTGDPLDIWGYATSSGEKLFLVFRGTQITSGLMLAQEWCEDALSLPLQPFGAGHVHLGFYGAWKALRQAVLGAAAQVGTPAANGKVITGHSLGAAIATLCWADLGGDLMTFASPRVGDAGIRDSAVERTDGQGDQCAGHRPGRADSIRRSGMAVLSRRLTGRGLCSTGRWLTI